MSGTTYDYSGKRGTPPMSTDFPDTTPRWKQRLVSTKRYTLRDRIIEGLIVLAVSLLTGLVVSDLFGAAFPSWFTPLGIAAVAAALTGHAVWYSRRASATPPTRDLPDSRM